jgi:hypothetical protein
MQRRRQFLPLLSGQPGWSSGLGGVAERGHLALGDCLQPIVAGLGRNTEQFLNFVGREACFVKECNSQLLGCFRISFSPQLLAQLLRINPT